MTQSSSYPYQPNYTYSVVVPAGYPGYIPTVQAPSGMYNPSYYYYGAPVPQQTHPSNYYVQYNRPTQAYPTQMMQGTIQPIQGTVIQVSILNQKKTQFNTQVTNSSQLAPQIAATQARTPPAASAAAASTPSSSDFEIKLLDLIFKVLQIALPRFSGSY